VGREALDGLDEVGDQVVPPLGLDVDLAPGLLRAVAQPDEAVVHADEPHDDQGDDDEQDDQRDVDGCHVGSLQSGTEVVISLVGRSRRLTV